MVSSRVRIIKDRKHPFSELYSFIEWMQWLFNFLSMVTEFFGGHAEPVAPCLDADDL